MLLFNNADHSTSLDERIAELLAELENLTGSDEEYTKSVSNLAKLMEIKNNSLKTGNESIKLENEKFKLDNDHFAEREKIDLDKDKLRLDEEKFNADQEKERSWKPSPDAIVGAAASVVGILFVLHYEKLGVVTSKALGFIGKLK